MNNTIRVAVWVAAALLTVLLSWGGTWISGVTKTQASTSERVAVLEAEKIHINRQLDRIEQKLDAMVSSSQKQTGR